MKAVLFQQYNLLGTLKGDLHTLYANVSYDYDAANPNEDMYVEDGFVWVDEDGGQGLPELLLLASTEKLVKLLQRQTPVAGANATDVTGENEIDDDDDDDVDALAEDNDDDDDDDDVDALGEAVEKISLDQNDGNQVETEENEEKNQDKTEETDEKESADDDMDEKEAEAGAEETEKTADADKKTESEIDETAEKKDDKTEVTDEKETAAGDGDTNEKETEVGDEEKEETADKKAETEIDQDKDPAEKAGGGPSKNAKNKAKQKKVVPLEDLVFQKLVRVNDLDDTVRIALDDVRAMKQRDYDGAAKSKKNGRGMSRDDQRRAALEHKRRRLHEQLSSNDSVTNSGSGDNTNSGGGSGSGSNGLPEDSDREDPWIRLIRVLNSVRLLAQILPPILLHERRNDKDLRIGNNRLQIKRNAPCWLLGEHVYDIVSGKSAKSNYHLLNEIFAYYFGMPPDFELTVEESTVWRAPLEQMMKTAIQQRRRSDEDVMKAPWIDVDPLEVLDATQLPALEKLTLELDEQHLVDTAGENPEQHERYLQSVKTLHERLNLILKQRFPTARLSIYGSCLSDLSLAKSSDVDLSLYLEHADTIRNSFELGKMAVAKYEKEMKGLVYDVCRKLEGRRDEFREMVPVARARVPVVKGRFLKAENPHAPDGSLHFDICFLNDIAVANSSLVREYSLVDTRVKQLMIAVKRWAKENNISSAQDNSLSSYAWMNMVIFYVQCVGLVPNLQDPKLMQQAGVTPDPEGNYWHRVNNLNTCFATWEQAKQVWTPPAPVSSNRSATALLYGFFRFYARDFPCSLFAISIKRGRESLIPKTSLQKCLVFYCIEDPFETFDSHCPHDLGTPAGEVGTKRLVQCVQKAESYCRETLLAALVGEDDAAATRPAITSLWPVPVGKSASAPRPPQTDNSRNNRNNGNGRNRGGTRKGTPRQEQAKDKTPQKQPQNQAKEKTPPKQPPNQAKEKTPPKQDQPNSQKEGNTKDTVHPPQPPKQNEGDAKQEQPSGNSQPAARPKKKRNPKPKATTQSFVVTMDDKGAAVVTNAPIDSTNNGDGSGGGNARKPRNIPKPANGNANGNQRGGRGGRNRARNNRSAPKSDQGNGQSNQESGSSNAPAPNA